MRTTADAKAEAHADIVAFDGRLISDSKRLVRGETWREVRRKLRIRDRLHHAPWRVLILAGGAPQEEIRCIKGLMPKAHITAIDVDPECVARAKSAGADAAIVYDALALPSNRGKERWAPAIGGANFDAVFLDFCGPVTDAVVKSLSRWQFQVSGRGLLILTCSYGRDVAEYFAAQVEHWEHGDPERVASLRALGVPEPLLGRLLVLPDAYGLALHHIAAYGGAHTPMACVMWETRPALDADTRFIKVDKDDFVLAVTEKDFDPSVVYACPAERILSLRRKAAARLAVHTRSVQQKDSAPTHAPENADQDPVVRALCNMGIQRTEAARVVALDQRPRSAKSEDMRSIQHRLRAALARLYPMVHNAQQGDTSSDTDDR